MKNIPDILMNWNASIVQTEYSWKANNIHIDEIDPKSTPRDQWLKSSFEYLMELCVNKEFNHDNLILFLHLELAYTETKQKITILSDNDLQIRLNESTPPSFHYLSFEYFQEFKNELYECSMYLNDEFLNNNTKGYFRTYFDESEEMYSGEVYIFCIR